MPTFSPHKYARGDGQAPFVTLDMSLAESGLTRSMLMDDIRQAVFNDGFFVLENYQDAGVTDETISSMLFQLTRFFSLADSAKAKLDMAQSPHFRGHFSYNNEPATADFDEELVLGTESVAPSQFDDDDMQDMSVTQTMGGTPVYEWLRGPNQWVSSRALPGFQRDTRTYMETMAQFGNDFVQNYLCAALGTDSSLFENAFDADEPQNTLRLIKKSGTMTDSNNKDPFTFRNKLAFASYLVRPENDASMLKIVSSDGHVTMLPPNPETIVVVLGEAAEHLSHGLCMSASYSLESCPVNSYVASFTQCVSVGFKFKNYVFPRSLLKQAAGSDIEIFDDDKETPAQFFDDFGVSAFNQYLNHYSSVASKWYSHLVSQSHQSSGTLPRKLELLLKLQKSIDKSILLHTISSTAPMTSSMLCNRVSQDSRLTFEMAYLQQILTIWQDAYIIHSSVVSRSEVTISIPPSLDRKVSLMNSLPARHAEFEQKCFVYASKNCCNKIPLQPYNIVPQVKLSSPTKLLSPRKGPARTNRTTSRELTSPYSLTRKAPLTGLSPSKLNTGLRSPPPSPVKTGSFMERIRAKEAAAKEALKTAESPELRHKRYIESKLASVAAVIAGLRNPRRKGVGETFALQNVLGKIRDSSKVTISPTESEEALRMLAERLPDLCTLTTVGKVTGVCVHNDFPITSIQERLATLITA